MAHRPIKTSLCGQEDCPTPYEFCEECVRADERSIDAPRLSKMLFESREAVEMYADIVESRTGAEDTWLRRLVNEIDLYRQQRGWSRHGFGNEASSG